MSRSKGSTVRKWWERPKAHLVLFSLGLVSLFLYVRLEMNSMRAEAAADRDHSARYTDARLSGITQQWNDQEARSLKPALQTHADAIDAANSGVGANRAEISSMKRTLSQATSSMDTSITELRGLLEDLKAVVDAIHSDAQRQGTNSQQRLRGLMSKITTLEESSQDLAKRITDMEREKSSNVIYIKAVEQKADVAAATAKTAAHQAARLEQDLGDALRELDQAKETAEGARTGLAMRLSEVEKTVRNFGNGKRNDNSAPAASPPRTVQPRLRSTARQDDGGVDNPFAR